MNMSFSAGPSPATAPAGPTFMRIHHTILREILRLPYGVTITGIRPDPEHPDRCIVDLDGAPGNGEVEPEYRMLHTTVIEFTGWKPQP